MNFPARIIARVVIVAAILGLGFASAAQADRSFRRSLHDQ